MVWPGRAVSLKLEQVVHGTIVFIGHALLVDLEVDLREDMVVAAGGDSESLVRLVEDHPTIHEGVGVVGCRDPILTALPPLLVSLHKLCWIKAKKKWRCQLLLLLLLLIVFHRIFATKVQIVLLS